GDVLHLVERRDVVPRGAILPGIAQLQYILLLILVVAPQAGHFRHARVGDGGFKARRLRDDEVRGDAAVGVATHAQLVWVRDASRDRVIHHGHVILIVLVAPIGKDGLAELLAMSRGTS